jgi:Icc-related predicted phosphoesterase
MNVGCELLRNRIEELNPTLNVFGHIHEGYGIYNNGKTTFVNASICTPDYGPTNKPIIIDLTEVDGQLIATYVEE